MDNRCILVVDDDTDIRITLAELLEMEGYRVLTATNGREALQTVQERKDVDLVLLDLMMPVMNGKEFLSAKQSDPCIRAIPVVLLSAGSRPIDLAESFTFLKKPVDAEHLLEIIQKCLLKPTVSTE